MKEKWTPSIRIWQLDLKEKVEEYPFQSLYFFTKRGAKRFLKTHEKEIKEDGIAWCIGGERLWFW